MTNTSNLAPGSEHDKRMGVDNDIDVDCPYCDGEGGEGGADGKECSICEGTGEIELGLFKILKAQEKEDREANS